MYVSVQMKQPDSRLNFHGKSENSSLLKRFWLYCPYKCRYILKATQSRQKNDIWDKPPAFLHILLIRQHLLLTATLPDAWSTAEIKDKLEIQQLFPIICSGLLFSIVLVIKKKNLNPKRPSKNPFWSIIIQALIESCNQVLTAHRTRQDSCSGLLFFLRLLLQLLMPARTYLKWDQGEVQEDVSPWAIRPHAELQGLQMGKKAAICLVTCWGLLGISCSFKSWEEAALKMPVCDNFKIWVLQFQISTAGVMVLGRAQLNTPWTKTPHMLGWHTLFLCWHQMEFQLGEMFPLISRYIVLDFSIHS